MDNIIYLNGDYVNKSQAKVSVMDRGFLFGDGVYELIPVYKSKIFLLEKHMKRLRASLRYIGMKNDFVEINNIGKIIKEIITRNNLVNSFVYIHVTRGEQSPRNHIYNNELPPTFLVMSENYSIFTKDQILNGFSATIQNDFRWTKSHIKSISLLGNVLLKNEASNNNCYETLLIRDNLLTEGAASNVFIVSENKIITPKLSENLLPGVTRDLILELAKNNNREIFEEDITSQKLLDATEIWCSSSTNYVVPITQVDKQSINNGVVGNITKHFYSLVSNYIQNL